MQREQARAAHDGEQLVHHALLGVVAGVLLAARDLGAVELLGPAGRGVGAGLPVFVEARDGLEEMVELPGEALAGGEESRGEAVGIVRVLGCVGEDLLDFDVTVLGSREACERTVSNCAWLRGERALNSPSSG